MAKKEQPEQDAEPQEMPAYRYRFSDNGAELAVRQDGHTVVLRYGDMVPGVPVRPKRPPYRHLQGTVTALLPGWGPSPGRVSAYVTFTLPVTIEDPGVRQPKPVRRFWPADELEIIPKVQT